MLDIQVELNKNPRNTILMEQEQRARDKYTYYQRAHNSFLAQKAKIDWVQNGDENTAIFHAFLKARRVHNRINCIRNERGIWMDKPGDIQQAFLSYYQKLLGTSMRNRRKVFHSIVAAGRKAPGPDGYGSSFYQDNWDLVGQEVGAAVTNFLNTGLLLKEINATTITLIPKVKCPNSVQDFRPISCCNVIYKAATKIICSRLRQILPDIIAENQGGFVHGRYIAYNIMVCQDIVRHYGRKNCKPSCMIKIYLRKAYDTIEWGFIEEMLIVFHFPQKFIDLIMSLKLFSMTSGLLPNNEKSAVYCSGMQEVEVARVLEMSGFNRAHLPFRYLGIPVCSKKNSAAECNGILEKMVARIRVWSTRHLSYMGRVTLINSVLITLHSYWAQIMVLPKRLLKGVEAICRAFLWKGLADSTSPGLVAWHQVCLPKTASGLGFRKVFDWNLAAMETGGSTRCLLIAAGTRSGMRYSIKAGHELLFEHPVAVKWSKVVWDRLSIPKHRFVLWLVMMQRLRTREQLHKFQPLIDQSCLLRGGDIESIGHLFFHCQYSSSCLQKIKQSLGWNSVSLNLEQLFCWTHKAKRLSVVRKSILYSVLTALVYHIWRVRNDAFWNNKVWHVDNTVQRVVREIQFRLSLVMPKKAKAIDREWVTKFSMS
ncbi:uncharacterized protein LOC133784711 [Humulus lupulus]|uniref:uncharacterized protein LOC133784711 n=1 Tax=Humulus lupulus TaxID=3486 RepID=UPI002B414E03|nr:uncharacterized protein LOC133784711 [Humulus lupulus]